MRGRQTGEIQRESADEGFAGEAGGGGLEFILFEPGANEGVDWSFAPTPYPSADGGARALSRTGIKDQCGLGYSAPSRNPTLEQFLLRSPSARGANPLGGMRSSASLSVKMRLHAVRSWQGSPGFTTAQPSSSSLSAPARVSRRNFPLREPAVRAVTGDSSDRRAGDGFGN